jgi:hypothetical protein
MFRQTHWGGTGVIGDSVFATQDSYDQRVYAVGKGPSELTTSINNNVVSVGSTVMVGGTVMDVSPGTKDDNRLLRFPTGVPAVSDESMSDWMLYVYKQFPRPADATGVTVKFEAVNPNGEYEQLGEAISDSYGNYAFEFKPGAIGQYMIIATFQGSNSYYPSTAVTYVSVVAAEADPGYQGPSASDIAAATVSQIPQYPTSPTASEIAAETVNQMPPYPVCANYLLTL